jgi:hypothetical protein
MGFNAKKFIDTVVGAGRGATSAGMHLARRLRGSRQASSPSGPPHDVGAPNAGEPRAPRSSTSTAAKQTAAKRAPKRAAKKKPAKRA